MENPLLEMVEKRKAGIHCGIPSFCCANKLVIEAILDQAKRFNDTVVIEATSNQVNQERGYTDMTPQDFRDFVYAIADRIHFSREKIILGGDHMGPLPWAGQAAAAAMKEAETLVRMCVRVGYQKIHLDTSMRLGDDPINRPLDDALIAERGARLYSACEEEYRKLKEKEPNAIHPVYVIGSEVPVPGGTQEKVAEQVTTQERFEKTLLAYHQKFSELGLRDAWRYIIAMVVQPGVEFGNHEIRRYDRLEAHALCQELRKYPDMVFEGHSTDFQSPVKLREMVEDGIAIIKVGPALTFALREALFALSCIEAELIPKKEDRANFIDVLERVMTEEPKHWEKYYFGTALSQHLDRKYSFSDRCRYYLAKREVDESIGKLFDNLSKVDIPMGLLHQYMPLQYIKVRDGKLTLAPKELAKDSVVSLVEDYNYAVKTNYVIGSVFVR